MPKFLDVPSWYDTEGNMDTIENYSKLGTGEKLVWTTLTGMQNVGNFFTMNASLPWDDIVQVRLHFNQSANNSDLSSAFPLTIEYMGADNIEKSALFVFQPGALANALQLSAVTGVFEETGTDGTQTTALYSGTKFSTTCNLDKDAFPGWGGVLTTYRGSNWSVECGNSLPMTSIITQVDYAIAETVSVDCQYLYDKIQASLFPVGAYYITESTTTPASLFGGSWVRVANRFLYGALSNNILGREGGAQDVLLKKSDLPPHAHVIHLQPNKGSINGVGFYDGGGGYNQQFLERAYLNMEDTGAQTYVSIMPPYRTVNIWRRIA